MVENITYTDEIDATALSNGLADAAGPADDVERDVLIRVRNVSKEYKVATGGSVQVSTARLFAQFRRRLRNVKRYIFRQPIIPQPPQAEAKGFWAVKDVSFDVRAGEVLGIIGGNGSGKTTLLKLVCRVTDLTTGQVDVHGRIGALLGVGTGFHPNFTGRQNIYISGSLQGLSRSDIDQRMDDIIAFADIGDFVERPVKNYSSGMRSRLGFAVAVQMEPEILILDEVLAVGDMNFQKKCLERIVEYKKSGKTIILVSHNMNAIKGYCDRVLMLDSGGKIAEGTPDDVVSQYLSAMARKSGSGVQVNESDRMGNGILRVSEIWFEDALDRRTETLIGGEAVTVCLAYATSTGESVKDVSVDFAVFDQPGQANKLFRLSTEVTGQNFEELPAQGILRIQIPILPMRAGEYKAGYRITVEGEEADYIGPPALSFHVINGDFYGTGIHERHSPMLVNHSWSVFEDTVEE